MLRNLMVLNCGSLPAELASLRLLEVIGCILDFKVLQLMVARIGIGLAQLGLVRLASLPYLVELTVRWSRIGRMSL